MGIPAEGLTLVHQGYGKITAIGTLAMAELNIYSLSSGGNLDLNIHSSTLSVYSNTHALINMSGSVTNAFIWMNKGIGRVHAEKLEAQSCTVQQGGSNEIRVFPIQKLKVDILQSGNVAYYHEPAELTSYIRGTGRLIKK
jgi:hypothetical protein